MNGWIWRKSMHQREIKSGKQYQHFKGNTYLVLHLAHHSETMEPLVVYQAIYGWLWDLG